MPRNVALAICCACSVAAGILAGLAIAAVAGGSLEAARADLRAAAAENERLAAELETARAEPPATPSSKWGSLEALPLNAGPGTPLNRFVNALERKAKGTGIRDPVGWVLEPFHDSCEAHFLDRVPSPRGGSALEIEVFAASSFPEDEHQHEFHVTIQYRVAPLMEGSKQSLRVIRRTCAMAIGSAMGMDQGELRRLGVMLDWVPVGEADLGNNPGDLLTKHPESYVLQFARCVRVLGEARTRAPGTITFRPDETPPTFAGLLSDRFCVDFITCAVTTGGQATDVNYRSSGPWWSIRLGAPHKSPYSTVEPEKHQYRRWPRLLPAEVDKLAARP